MKSNAQLLQDALDLLGPNGEKLDTGRLRSQRPATGSFLRVARCMPLLCTGRDSHILLQD
jgi:hypothetical protein